MSLHVPPWVNPVWDSLFILDLGKFFLSYFMEVFSYYLFKYFLSPFLFLFYFWDPYNVNVPVFSVVPDVSNFPYFFFFLFCSASVISHTLIFQLINPFFSLVYSAIYAS